MKNLLNLLLLISSVSLVACGAGNATQKTSQQNPQNFVLPPDGTYYIKTHDMKLTIENHKLSTIKFRDDPIVHHVQSLSDATKCLTGQIKLATGDVIELDGINCSATQQSITTTLTLAHRAWVTVTFFNNNRKIIKAN